MVGLSLIWFFVVSIWLVSTASSLKRIAQSVERMVVSADTATDARDGG